MYVLGFATDWRGLLGALRQANVPLYLAWTILDKLLFFVFWGWLQAKAVRRFVQPVSTREVIAVRGGAELVRAASGPLADAAFLYGMARISRGSMAAVVAAAGVPLACHFVVLMLQATLALAFLSGGSTANGDVAVAAGIGWTIVLGVAVAARLGLWRRFVTSTGPGAWLANVEPRSLLPFLGWFALFAAFDVIVQGLSSRAFGVAIDWWALAGRIPILYFVLSLPSFGNFGTRELAWAACFSEYGTREELVAYALATNTVFLLLHVAIGVAFLPRAVSLVSDLRRARREGEALPQPLLRDASDP